MARCASRGSTPKYRCVVARFAVVPDVVEARLASGAHEPLTSPFDPDFLECDDVEIEVICPDEMVTHLFMDHPQMYPQYQEAARRVIAGKRAR